MPIRVPKSKIKQEKTKCCCNCFMAYKTRYNHHIVMRCKQWGDKVVNSSETCDKFAPIISIDGMVED